MAYIICKLYIILHFKNHSHVKFPAATPIISLISKQLNLAPMMSIGMHPQFALSPATKKCSFKEAVLEPVFFLVGIMFHHVSVGRFFSGGLDLLGLV